MSGVDINAIREAIAAQIAAHVPAVHCYAFDPGDSVNYPCAIVYPAGGPGGEFIGYQQTFGPRGIAGVEMAVEVRVTAPDPVVAQKAMGVLVSTGNPGSVHDALMAPDSTDGQAITLGGVVENMFVPSVSPFVVRAGAVPELVAVFRLIIKERR
jgi:hypothetical protein